MKSLYVTICICLMAAIHVMAQTASPDSGRNGENRQAGLNGRVVTDESEADERAFCVSNIVKIASCTGRGDLEG